MMKAKGTFLVPTVAGVDAQVEAHKNDHASAEDRKRVEAFLQAIQESVQTAKSLAVKIAAGYDASSAERQGRNADELVALTKRGMTPTEAIQAATINAAELMNWQDRVGRARTRALRRRDCGGRQPIGRHHDFAASEVCDERRKDRKGCNFRSAWPLTVSLVLKILAPLALQL
jgi:intracellular sulfur oxidation DsrE/DsrF family protein